MRFNHTGNNSWLFQKAYYKGFDWEKKTNDKYAPEFFNERLSWLKKVQLTIPEKIDNCKEIHLKTTYPGLATGIGVTHETKSTGELKLGFDFDYSYGMPVIRGHSVKGVLRSAFPQEHRKNIRFKKEKAFQIFCWLNNKEFTFQGLNDFTSNPELLKEITAYELEIFEGRDRNGELLSLYSQDVFFDSFISIASKYPSTQNQYLGNDSITPHKKKGKSYEESMLKNPIPLPFLKILPGITITFRFDLHDNGLLSIEQKQALFLAILIEHGAGAKTNVGYGQLEPV